MAKNSLSTKDLVGMTLPKFFMLIILLMILFFLPAGT
jgi:hypothetical protein